MMFGFKEILHEPPQMPLRALAGWVHLFEAPPVRWMCIRNKEGNIIMFDETFELANAYAFQTDEEFIGYLDAFVKHQLEKDPQGFLKSLMRLPHLATGKVMEAMMEALEQQ